VFDKPTGLRETHRSARTSGNGSGHPGRQRLCGARDRPEGLGLRRRGQDVRDARRSPAGHGRRQLAGHHLGARLRAQGDPAGPGVQGNAGRRDHDEPGRLRRPAGQSGRVHAGGDPPFDPSPAGGVTCRWSTRAGWPACSAPVTWCASCWNNRPRQSRACTPSSAATTRPDRPPAGQCPPRTV